jgi:phage-related protein
MVDRKPVEFLGNSLADLRAFPKSARRDATGAFRVIFVAKFSAAVYVLHCFQKATQKTRQSDLDLAARRYRELTRELSA